MANRFLYPRPEYPRPDRQRGFVEGQDWLNLNGPWQFRFDGENRGVEDKWFLAEPGQWREQIIVPFCWESLAAWGDGDSAGNDNFYSTRVFRNPLAVTPSNHRSAPRYEIGWYRRQIEVPSTAEWQGKRVILTIGAADFYTDAWCNGHPLGHHEGGYTPFEFDLTDTLLEEKGRRLALIVLRVEDPMDNAEQPVGKQWRWYTTTSGIWQTVYLEPRSQAHIRSFRIAANLDDGTARFELTCPNAQDSCEVALDITTPDGLSQGAVLKLNAGQCQETVPLASTVKWDPNTPELYRVRFELRRAGKVLDTVRSYFGLRKIDFELASESGVPACLRVNGQPRYLRGALYQSFFPEGIYTAPTVDVLKNDIEAARKLGFNFLRVHIKIDDPLLLYWADKLGILLMADFPNFGEGGDTPLGRQRFEAMMREAIERDFNHPSIFAWCLFNETWGFGGQTGFLEQLLSPKKEGLAAEGEEEKTQTERRPAVGARPGMTPPQEWVQQMWELAKQLDPTRMVEDMSVCHWEHLEYYLHCDTDINSWHFYISDYAKAKAHIDKVVRSTYVGSSFNYVPGFKHRGQPLINSEYGGVGALDGDRDVSWSFKFLTNELRRHNQISAYIYTELHDVEWEYNGCLNYDRTPKDFGYDPRLVNESNTLPIDVPPIQKVRPGETVRLKVASSHYSTHPSLDVSLHWGLGGIDTYGHFHQDLLCGRVPIPFPHLQVAPAHTLELRMPETPMLCTLLLSAQNAEGLVIAENFAHFLVSAEYPPELEETGRALILRGLPANWTQSQWSGGTNGRDEQGAEDSCYGFGSGFFEWTLPLRGAELSKAHRIKVLCEASSHRSDSPQTDAEVFPTTLRLQLNDVPLYEGVIRNHPHDSRGVLSYMRGGKGAYGYLVHAFAEYDLIQQIARQGGSEAVRLRCSVPSEVLAQGGLTLYGAECGRFPISPTVIVEW